MDQIVEINDRPFNAENYAEVLQSYDEDFKLGDTVSFTVKRKVSADEMKEVKLTADLRETSVTYPTLEPEASPTAQEMQLRNAWMGKASE
jgi:hypothetical protein